MKKIAWALTCAAAILIGTGAAQAATVITFDDLTVTGVIETDVTTQYAGVTFGGARLLNSPGQLNDFNFPPFTAPNVIANDANGILQPLSLTFDMPVTSVGAYLTTMAVPLTLSAFDGATFLGSTSFTVANFANGGTGTPNAFISIAFPQITRVEFFNGNYGSFTLDNVTIDGGAFTGVSAVPEPATWALFLLGFGAIGWTLRNRQHLNAIAASA